MRVGRGIPHTTGGEEPHRGGRERSHGGGRGNCTEVERSQLTNNSYLNKNSTILLHKLEESM